MERLYIHTKKETTYRSMLTIFLVVLFFISSTLVAFFVKGVTENLNDELVNRLMKEREVIARSEGLLFRDDPVGPVKPGGDGITKVLSRIAVVGIGAVEGRIVFPVDAMHFRRPEAFRIPFLGRWMRHKHTLVFPVGQVCGGVERDPWIQDAVLLLPWPVGPGCRHHIPTAVVPKDLAVSNAVWIESAGNGILIGERFCCRQWTDAQQNHAEKKQGFHQ